MSEQPTRYKFTIRLQRRFWGHDTLVISGTHSSVKDGELLIHDTTAGAYHSFNFARVVQMSAVPVEGTR